MTTMTPQAIVQGLVARGLPPHVALGIAGNLAVESGFDPGINERAPLVEGSRGGFGLAQWTGPRRRQLEAFAADRGAPVSDPNLQLDFLMWEIGNSEAGNMRDTLAAGSPEEAAAEFMSDFLRPGIPHADRRLEATREIAGAFGGYGPVPGAQNTDPRIAGAFAPAPPPPYGVPTSGNALASLGPSSAAPVPLPNALGAPQGGNALAGDPTQPAEQEATPAASYALPEGSVSPRNLPSMRDRLAAAALTQAFAARRRPRPLPALNPLV